MAVRKECHDNNIVRVNNFAATLRQCLIDCNVRANCLSVFYNAAQKECFLKSKRCTKSELIANSAGTDYYRLSEYCKFGYGGCCKQLLRL